jgi:Zn ribbon nucleic-acid-binding protein
MARRSQRDKEQHSDEEAERRFPGAVKAGSNAKPKPIEPKPIEPKPIESLTAKSVPAPSKKKSKAKRERFVTPVTCPQCALNGSAAWEESERGNLETTIKSVSDGFRIDRGTEIYCADCGVKATIGRTLSRSETK